MNTLSLPPLNDIGWNQLLNFLNSLNLIIATRIRNDEEWKIVFTTTVPVGFQTQIGTKIQEIQLGVTWSDT